MHVYLDASCFNRAFDDQGQGRGRDETEAVLRILQRIVEAEDTLVWSSALTLELSAHPEPSIRSQLLSWKERSQSAPAPSESVCKRAEDLVNSGLKALDAAHVSFAEAARCDVFLACDDRLLRRASWLELTLRVLNPIQYVQEIS